MADENKITVEVIKNETPKVEPNYSWWICYRDKKEDGFKALSTNSLAEAQVLLERLGAEQPGREIHVAALVESYLCKVSMEMLPHKSASGKRCVN